MAKRNGVRNGGKALLRQQSRTLSIARDPSPERTLANSDGLKFWPAKCANTEVEQCDGAFFESFTALVWKQENKRRRAACEENKNANTNPPLENHFGPRHKERPLSRKEFELLYIEVLYTIKHKIGITSGHHLPFIQDLYLYAREAFGVTPEEHARLLAKASEEKPPVVVVNVTVVEARGLEAKDADGYSDPYCMLGIIPGSRVHRERLLDAGHSGSCSSDDEIAGRGVGGRKESALKKFSQSFKRRGRGDKTARDLVPARYIKATAVINNSLDPVWNEKFRFDLESAQTDRLHLDIWDHDDEFSVVDAARKLNEVQGFKGLGRYFKQIAQSARTSSKESVDDFLGSLDISFHDIPSTGLDDWFDLEARSSRSNIEGQIRFKMCLATREDRGISEEDNYNEIVEHENLMSVFIEHEIKNFKGEIYHWQGHMSKASQTILHQHAIQGDLTEVQQAMCRWSTYSRKHKQHPFDWHLLLRLSDALEEEWEPGSMTRGEEECLGNSFQEFINYCLNLIVYHMDIYPTNNKIAQVRFECMLKCLSKLYGLQVFTRCCPFQKEIHNEASTAIKRSASHLYREAFEQVRTETDGDDDAIQTLVLLGNKLNLVLNKALVCYSGIFDKIVGTTYFSTMYREMDRLFGDFLSSRLQTLRIDIPEVDEQRALHVSAQQMGLHVFELYLALQEFGSFKEHLIIGERKALSLTSFYELFKGPVERWITVSKHKLLNRIKTAVELDKVEQVDGSVKQSTSAVDVACCFGQIVDFWKCIEWKDHPGAVPYVTRISEDMCHGGTYYADLIHAKLKTAGYYDEIGQFDITEQLCITINDIEQVRRALKPLPDALKFGEIIANVEKHEGENVARQAKHQLHVILRAADEEMIHKIKLVVDRVADKMRPDIKKDVFHLCWAPEKVAPEEAIGDLMNYLDSNLVTLNSNLFRSNFDRILDSIWVEVLEEMREVLDTEDVKANWFFERLYASLDILVEFFYANEKGLPLSVLKNDYYQDLHRQLELNSAETRDLLEIFHVEKIHEQDIYHENRYGTLSVRVYYNTDAEILSVEVLNARNILPLDPNGLSDPFVLIELCPHQVFPKQTVQKTKIIKKSLNPTFDESFEFCVTPQQCQYRGACVLFTVMDHDFLLTNDFAGEVFFSLNNIPGIRGEEVSGFSALNPIALPLTQPKKANAKTKAKGALRALEQRNTDKEAMDFVKKRRDVESQSQNVY